MIESNYIDIRKINLDELLSTIELTDENLDYLRDILYQCAEERRDSGNPCAMRDLGFSMQNQLVEFFEENNLWFSHYRVYDFNPY